MIKRNLTRFSKKHTSVKSLKHSGKQYSKKVGSTKVIYWKSTKPSKKWMTINPKGKKVYWGHPTMQDYTQHHDKERRRLFRKRMSGVRLKNGSRAIDKKWSPAWLSYYVTW